MWKCAASVPVATGISSVSFGKATKRPKSLADLMGYGQSWRATPVLPLYVIKKEIPTFHFSSHSKKGIVNGIFTNTFGGAGRISNKFLKKPIEFNLSAITWPSGQKIWEQSVQLKWCRMELTWK